MNILLRPRKQQLMDEIRLCVSEACEMLLCSKFCFLNVKAGRWLFIVPEHCTLKVFS